MLRLAAQTPNYRAQKLITARVRALWMAERVVGAAARLQPCATGIFERLVRNSSFTLFTFKDSDVESSFLIETDVTK